MSLRLGVPTSIQQCSVGLGMVLMQRLINSFGVDTISAITAAMKLESFAMVPIMMFYMGLSNLPARTWVPDRWTASSGAITRRWSWP